MTPSFCKTQIKEIESQINEVKEYDDQINNIMEKFDISVSDEEYYNNELDGQAEYNLEVGLDLGLYENHFSPQQNENVVSTDKFLEVMSKLTTNEGKPPPLECGVFTEKEKDKFAFSTLKQFSNVIASRRNLTDSAKLTYLIGYLRDYALKVVKHLSISDENYHLAIQMLKEEFLDVKCIIDETYKIIQKAAPSSEYDPEFTSARVYLNEMRSYLHELKGQNIDLLEENTAGHSLISHIVFNKLPLALKRELVHRLSNNYPTITEIFDNYNEAIKTLNKTFPNKKTSFNKVNAKTAKTNSNAGPTKSKEGKSTIQNFKTQNSGSKFTCKLCSPEGHSLGKCSKFNNYQDKLQRLQDLSLCIRCAGSGHDENECYGKQGKLRF